ncbi:tetratricopeptide (TPR) repeat protein [Sporomusaceae bacterium BoRhaA]|uniref:tetratricopeptide repeat protein n=1 Tax=Pelorhabdus rhamnosifermentans TaxID=2772457 RepID=UPI001C061580|nr:tetratricopeptide repeat protein [Pelorhabdus rhamnosifermentans]MBU2701292.1 tetratricopeptide (TPR) repeat protein [Pelorhabdus rhamnosifermentans]
MFFFKKKNQSTDVAASTTKTEVVGPDLRVRIEQLKNELEVANSDLRIQILNELGSKLFALQETDAAIQYYELSIQENRSLGKAYTDLLKLYNIKRKEAALSNNDKQVQQYLNKIDALMKLSKDVIRGLD